MMHFFGTYRAHSLSRMWLAATIIVLFGTSPAFCSGILQVSSSVPEIPAGSPYGTFHDDTDTATRT
jgi:hypothetical protein